MTWKYLNPGDYRLLHNYDANYMVNYSNKTAAPVTGVCFGATSSSPTYPITIPSGTKEIWAAFTCFGDNVSSYAKQIFNLFFYGSAISNYSHFLFSIGASYINLSINGTFFLYAYKFSDLAPCSRVWLHFQSGNSAVAEVFVNNVQIYSGSNLNIMNGEDIGCYQFRGQYNCDTLSDIIFSDEPIDKDEHVVALPIGTTNADGWTYDATNDLYVADSAGKTIWQVPDINQLKKVTGIDNPSVTAVAVQAYNVSTNDTSQVDTLQKSVKQNGQTVITDSADISSATNVISPAMTINPVTNAAWTLNDLSNIQLGVTTAKA